MPADLFSDPAARTGTAPLTVIRAELLSHTGWQSLFEDYTVFKGITFSSSIEFLLRLAGRLDDVEIVFGTESILSREHRALLAASQTVQAYGFADALADQKALVEALARLLGRGGRSLLARVAARTLRFRLLKGRPSHEKLYLLSGPAGHRVLTGSANLRLAAFEGRQHEITIAFDGAALFDGYYRHDWQDSVPVEPDALRSAAALGAELKELALPRDKLGRTVVNAANVPRVIRSYQARPLADAAEDRIPRADIDFATGLVTLNGQRWLHADETIPPEAIARDARMLIDYLDSFHAFFGNAEGAIDAYWAFLVWLYAGPVAPYLRQAAVPVGIDPWVYPVYAVLFGRSSGGKTLFTRVAARSMFGFEKMIRSGQFTANRALGLRERLGAIPLLIDDVTRDKFSSHVPDLVRTDQETSGQYAPVVLTTNRDVSTIPPDLTKRMATCHIDAAIPENRSVTERIARRAQREIGTALYRAYLQRLIPEAQLRRRYQSGSAVRPQCAGFRAERALCRSGTAGS